MLNITPNSYVLPFISKPNLVRAPLILSGYKALQRTSSDLLYPVFTVKERNRKGEKSKSLGLCSLPKLKEVPKVLPQVTSVSVHLPPLRAGHSPSGVYNNCKRSEADIPDKGNQTSPVPGRLADRAQSQEEAQINTQTVVDLTLSLGWIINQEKSKLKPTQVFSFVGYGYHLDSALVKPTQERWLKLQDLFLRLKSNMF